MIKLVFAFLVFLREVFSERKEEMQFTSVNFSIRRSVFFFLLIIAVGINLFLINRMYAVMVRYEQLEARHIALIYERVPIAELTAELEKLKATNLCISPLTPLKK